MSEDSKRALPNRAESSEIGAPAAWLEVSRPSVDFQYHEMRDGPEPMTPTPSTSMDFHTRRIGACRAELTGLRGGDSWLVEGGNGKRHRKHVSW